MRRMLRACLVVVFGMGICAASGGQQTLTLFQANRVAERPITDLSSATTLLDEYARLRPQASAARVAALQLKPSANLVAMQP